jgi:cobalt-zinc-cadmium efflux system protein
MRMTAAKTRSLGLAAALNASMGVAQVIVGFATGSMAVLADAAHQWVDVVGLLLAFVAMLVVRRPISTRRTFGWTRVDALAAHISTLLLLGSLLWIGIESVKRLLAPQPAEGGWVIVIGVIGLIVNTAGAVMLGGHQHHHSHDHDHSHDHNHSNGPIHEDDHQHGGSLSIRAARLHLIGDAAGSLVVVMTGIVLSITENTRIDPIASLIICALVMFSAVRLLRQSGNELLDAVPTGLDVSEVTAALQSVTGIHDVHHLHAWSMGAGRYAVSAHIEVDGDRTAHDTQTVITAARTMVRDRFGIGHATFQPECHRCEEPVH